MAEAGFEHRGAFVVVDERISPTIVASSRAVPGRERTKTALRVAHKHLRRTRHAPRVARWGLAPAVYFNWTEPFTLAVTAPVPAATGISWLDETAIARIIIGRGGGALPLSVSTVTSRTTKLA